MICPNCDGQKYHAFPGPDRPLFCTCYQCGGTGELTDTQARWYEHGRRVDKWLTETWLHPYWQANSPGTRATMESKWVMPSIGLDPTLTKDEALFGAMLRGLADPIDLVRHMQHYPVSYWDDK